MYADLIKARRMTGRALRVGLFESPAAVSITEDHIVVLINRASVTERKHGFEIRRRGNTIYEFTKHNDTWVMAEPLTVWYELGESEVHATYPGRTPEEHEAYLAWAEMCHRPGTERSPMDNAERRAQGIK